MNKTINTAEKTVRDADRLSKALKESTEQSLKDIMSEALSKMLKESDDTEDNDKDDDDDNDELEKSYEVEDVDTNDTDDNTNKTQTDDKKTSDNEGEKVDDSDNDEDSNDTDDEWLDMEKYKVGDNDYDFTGVDGETALKVYNKLGDDDKICIQKDGEGKYTVKDDETGAEYEIELNADDITNDEGENDININNSDDDTDISIDFDDDVDVDKDSDEDIDIELTDDSDDDSVDLDDDDSDEDLDIELTDDDSDLDNDDDDDILSEEGLGYTTDYQKNIMPGLNATETANSNDTYSMDGGTPDGNDKPYGKKGNDTPFDEKVNEGEEIEVGEASNIEEGAMTTSSQSVAKATHTPTSTPRAEHARQVAKNLHSAGEYKALQESAKKIYEKAKQIQAENKQYKDCIDKIKISLREAAVLNVTLAQVVKLLSEETTSAKEKKSIVERFNKVKTIKESKQLYDTIKNELNENKKSGVVLEKIVSANPTQKLNETTIYRHNNPSLDLMKRMDSLYK